MSCWELSKYGQSNKWEAWALTRNTFPVSGHLPHQVTLWSSSGPTQKIFSVSWHHNHRFDFENMLYLQQEIVFGCLVLGTVTWRISNQLKKTAAWQTHNNVFISCVWERVSISVRKKKRKQGLEMSCFKLLQASVPVATCPDPHV